MDLSYDSSKRRRTTLVSPNLVDLPLTAIADYLPSTNRLLLAVALTASSLKDIGWNNAKLSTASKAVLASKEYWELDFAEIHEFAGDPSDEDLRALLLSIDAKNTLKTLRLEGCTQIVGHGLEPLRESTVLQCLSLPYRRVNGVESMHALSIDIVVPIVVSMINAGTNPLDRLDLLRNLSRGWLREQSRNESPLRGVLTNINQLLLNENVVCSCGNPFIRACFTCFERTCSVNQPCDDRPYCDLCDNCGITLCESWDQYCCGSDSIQCFVCESQFCSACAQLDTVDAACGCKYHGSEPTCFGCTLTRHEPCGDCLVLRLPQIIARNQAQLAEITQLHQQIDQLQMNDD